jgi:hypothetical protein
LSARAGCAVGARKDRVWRVHATDSVASPGVWDGARSGRATLSAHGISALHSPLPSFGIENVTLSYFCVVVQSGQSAAAPARFVWHVLLCRLDLPLDTASASAVYHSQLSLDSFLETAAAVPSPKPATATAATAATTSTSTSSASAALDQKRAPAAAGAAGVTATTTAADSDSDSDTTDPVRSVNQVLRGLQQRKFALVALAPSQPTPPSAPSSATTNGSNGSSPEPPSVAAWNSHWSNSHLNFATASAGTTTLPSVLPTGHHYFALNPTDCAPCYLIEFSFQLLS